MAEKICIYCMNGVIRSGSCTHCHLPDLPDKKRSPCALPPRILLNNRYYIGKVLGQGGYGITYLAWDVVSKCRRAVKELYPRYMASRSADSFVTVSIHNQKDMEHIRLRFRQEAQMLQQMQSVQEIVGVYDLFEENGTLYYVMEFLDGESLQAQMRRTKKMTWEQLAPIIRQVIRALDASHSCSLIHRDVSPDNIQILPNGIVKLMDFGNARFGAGEEELTVVVKEKLTPYEQYEKKGNQGPWTDVYSLCATIYYVTTGILPTVSVDRVMQIRMGQPDPVVPLSALRPELPAFVSKAVQKGMMPFEVDRYLSVRALADDLFPGDEIFSDEKALRFQKTGERYLMEIAGHRKGQKFPLPAEKLVTVGRSEGAVIAFPKKTPGVSRMQCSFLADREGKCYVRDENSSFGTKHNDGFLPPQQWVLCQIGDKICFGGEQFCLY